jgi:hypothetical protein
LTRQDAHRADSLRKWRGKNWLFDVLIRCSDFTSGHAKTFHDALMRPFDEWFKEQRYVRW